jgi:hypothetical protein
MSSQFYARVFEVVVDFFRACKEILHKLNLNNDKHSFFLFTSKIYLLLCISTSTMSSSDSQIVTENFLSIKIEKRHLVSAYENNLENIGGSPVFIRSVFSLNAMCKLS